MPRILVVDDEPRVLSAIRRILSGQFEVMTVLGTQEVAEVITAQEPFDAVIADFMMPGNMTGVEVLQLARGHSPTIGCILHSGGAPEGVRLEDVVRDHCPPGTVLLQKPAMQEEILAALRQVLPQW